MKMWWNSKSDISAGDLLSCRERTDRREVEPDAIPCSCNRYASNSDERATAFRPA